MTLAEYLLKNDLRAAHFAEAVGITHSALSKYLAGHQTPGLEVAGRILVASKGAIDFHDHLDPALARKIKAARK